MRKKERAAIVIERLKKEYPGADCTLDYNEAWKLLVSVRLAAQCTDERVNIIVKDLFAKSKLAFCSLRPSSCATAEIARLRFLLITAWASK